MFFLIRVAFWLSLVILLIPIGSSGDKTTTPQVGAADALAAAGAAVSDMKQFCSRQPGACEVGSQAASAFGQKAQAGAKMVYDFLTDKLGDDNAVAAKKPVTATAAQSQDTLKAGDRTPAWRGPQQPRTAEQGARRPS